MQPMQSIALRSLVMALVALVTLVPFVAGGCSPGAKDPNLILITLDTTRADHLSCYGYQRQTTPNLDRFAADALRFTRCYAVTSWTLPAHASLFTGKFPSAHGAQYDPEGPLELTQGIAGNPAWRYYRARPLSDKEVTLAQILRAEGYATGAVIAGPWLKQVFGLDLGFEEYDDENFIDRGSEGGGELNGRPGEDVTRAAIDFVDRHADEPFFLFLNYYDPHSPWIPEEAFLKRFWKGPQPTPEQRDEFNNALYDAELAYMDHHLGRFFEHLLQSGLYEESWIVVTADHGELLGDDGMYGHGNSLSQAEVHIPLIIKEPGADRPRRTDDSIVQQVDVMPHLLERLGLPKPPNMQGVPIPGRGHPIVAEVYPLPFMGASKGWRQQGDWRVIFHDRYKFAWSGNGTHLLFDLEADPTEAENILEREPERGERLERILTKYIEELPEPGELGDVGQVDEETLEMLRGLGYIGDDG